MFADRKTPVAYTRALFYTASDASRLLIFIQLVLFFFNSKKKFF